VLDRPFFLVVDESGGGATVAAEAVDVDGPVVDTGAGTAGVVTVVLVGAGTLGVGTLGVGTLGTGTLGTGTVGVGTLGIGTLSTGTVVGVDTETVTVVTGVVTVVVGSVGSVTVGSADPREEPTAGTFAAKNPVAATQATAIGKIARRFKKRSRRNDTATCHRRSHSLPTHILFTAACA